MALPMAKASLFILIFVLMPIMGTTCAIDQGQAVGNSYEDEHHLPADHASIPYHEGYSPRNDAGHHGKKPHKALRKGDTKMLTTSSKVNNSKCGFNHSKLREEPLKSSNVLEGISRAGRRSVNNTSPPLGPTKPSHMPQTQKTLDHGPETKGGFNLDAALPRPQFNNFSASWVGKNCSVLSRVLAKKDPNAWKETEAELAWSEILSAWFSPEKNSYYNPGTNFTDFVFQQFGQESGHCDDINEQCGTRPAFGVDDCNTQKVPPAAVIIMNNLMNLNHFVTKCQQAVSQAETITSNEMMIVASVFAQQSKQEEKDKEIASAILGVFSTILGLVSAGSISSAFNAIQKSAQLEEDATQKALDVAKGATSFASTIAKQLPAPQNPDSVKDDLNAILGQAVDNVETCLQYWLGNMTWAHSMDQVQNLTDFLSSGALMAAIDDVDLTDLKHNIQKAQIGQAIQPAISMSPQKPHPFILRVDSSQHQCNTSFHSNDPLGKLFEKDAHKNVWCDPRGNSWYFLDGKYDTTGSGVGSFGKVPGATHDVLNGTQGFLEGIQLSDLIVPAVAGFNLNNKQNGYSMSPPGELTTNSSDLSVSGNGLPGMDSILTPGFFNWTICLDYKEASRSLAKSVGHDGKAAICGKSPSPGDSSNLNTQGSFTPGRCRVHWIQYQKHDGNSNPLNDYQFEVNVTDGAGLPIGSAAKQSASDRIMVSDTSLPYGLLIWGGNVDHDPVNFM